MKPEITITEDVDDMGNQKGKIKDIPLISDDLKFVARDSLIKKRKKKPDATIREDVVVGANEDEIKPILLINDDHKLLGRDSVIKKRKKKPEVIQQEDIQVEVKEEEMKHNISLINDDDKLVPRDSVIKKRKKPEVTLREDVVEVNKKEEEMQHIPTLTYDEEKLLAIHSRINKRKKKPGILRQEDIEMKKKEEEMKYIPLVSDEIVTSESVQSDEVLKQEVPEVEQKYENQEKVEEVEKVDKEVKNVIVVEKVVQEQVKNEVKDETPKERIVTEWMLFRTGAPVDYSYSENATNPDDIVSVPGCPKSVDGYPWVLYGKPEPKCYLVGQRSSVCQGSSMMNYQKGSEYGVCACNFQECLAKRGLPSTTTSEGELLTNANLLRRRNGVPGKLRYRFCRPLGVSCEEFVYDQKEKRCDIMYSQSPCKEGEWLQRNSKGGVECAPRLCDGEAGLSEKSETFHRTYGNLTKDDAECCKSWGGFAVASIITSLTKLSSCDAGQVYSKTLNKCITPFKASGLTVG